MTQADERMCPDCGCPEWIMLRDGMPCCEAEWCRATGRADAGAEPSRFDDEPATEDATR